MPAIVKNRRAYTRLAQLIELAETATPYGRALEIGTFAASIALDWYLSQTSVGPWAMPASGGWTHCASCVSSGPPADWMQVSTGVWSPAVEALVDACIANQAISPGFPPNTSIVNSLGVAFWYTQPGTGLPGSGTARYTARDAYERPSSDGVPRMPYRPPNPMVRPEQPFSSPYTKGTEQPLEAPAPLGDVGFDILPNGTVRPVQSPRGKPPRGTKEGKSRNARLRRLAGVIMRAVDHLSEFYEFNEAAADALDYDGPDNMRDKLIWLWWDGHMDELSFEEIYRIRTEQDVTDRMYGKWQQSLDKSLETHGGISHPIGTGTGVDL